MSAILSSAKATALAGRRCWPGQQQTRALPPPPLRQQQRQVNPRRQRQRPAATTAALATVEPSTIAIVRTDRKLERAQAAVLDAIAGVQGRGKGGMSEEQRQQFEEAVATLEADGGVQDPTSSPLLDGRWRLLYTTRPGTSSPIQRTFTAVDKFSVYQDIELADMGQEARVSQVVDFGPTVGFLRVEAEANTDGRPLEGFSPREGQGLPFGIMGRSSTQLPARPDMRIGFQFDRAAFTFNALPFRIPYPVPFKLLGDERKGWIDITYLSPDGKLRLSRGNKGTLFVLCKDIPAKDRLLEALGQGGRSDDEILDLALELQEEGGGEAAPATSPLAAGTWRLVWTMQGQTANRFQKALANQVENFQIITPEGRLDNLVCLTQGVRVRACAACQPDSDTRTGVAIDQVVLELGPLSLPLPIKPDGRGFVDWMYLDQNMRVTQGNKGSIFIHTREPASSQRPADSSSQG